MPTTGAFIDRELYLPQRWTEDPDRCAEAGVPADRGFVTKPEFVIRMLERVWTAEVMFGVLRRRLRLRL